MDSNGMSGEELEKMFGEETNARLETIQAIPPFSVETASFDQLVDIIYTLVDADNYITMRLGLDRVRKFSEGIGKNLRKLEEAKQDECGKDNVGLFEIAVEYCKAQVEWQEVVNNHARADYISQELSDDQRFEHPITGEDHLELGCAKQGETTSELQEIRRGLKELEKDARKVYGEIKSLGEPMIAVPDELTTKLKFYKRIILESQDRIGNLEHQLTPEESFKTYFGHIEDIERFAREVANGMLFRRHALAEAAKYIPLALNKIADRYGFETPDREPLAEPTP